MAVLRLSSSTGITNSSANSSFEKNVAIVAVHICFVLWWFSASSDMCIPSESEKASAIAMVNIPPRTIILECVPEFSPTISPSVVIIPDVSPNPNPFLTCVLTVIILSFSIKKPCFLHNPYKMQAVFLSKTLSKRK